MYVSSIAVSASVGTACTGGLDDVLTEHALMTTGRRLTRMTRHTRMSRHGCGGVTGTSRESRRTGVEAVHFIRSITAQGLQNIKAAR